MENFANPFTVPSPDLSSCERLMSSPDFSEAWMRMVLNAMPSPGWLSASGVDTSIVLSSRVRIMRNLVGYRFVHASQLNDLQIIMRKVMDAAGNSGLDFEAFKSLTNAERDYLVGCRLVSPDFEWTLPGRALLVDKSRQLSVMVNEEDHIRIQALTPGLSISQAHELADRVLSALSLRLEFAYSPTYGNLSASYINVGSGKRLSAMCHLIGLAQARRLPAIIHALSSHKIVVRGLFGESSRAVGAFAQVSVIGSTTSEFAGACDYLVSEEKKAREAIPIAKVLEKANQAREYALSSRVLTLADALRIFAWIRWAASENQPGFHFKIRDIDSALTLLEVRGGSQDELGGKKRAEFVRNLMTPT
jgi:protein arginine kinase